MLKNSYLFEKSWIQKDSQKIRAVNVLNQDVTKSIVIVTVITKSVVNFVYVPTAKTLTLHFSKRL